MSSSTIDELLRELDAALRELNWQIQLKESETAQLNTVHKQRIDAWPRARGSRPRHVYFLTSAIQPIGINELSCSIGCKTSRNRDIGFHDNVQSWHNSINKRTILGSSTTAVTDLGIHFGCDSTWSVGFNWIIRVTITSFYSKCFRRSAQHFSGCPQRLRQGGAGWATKALWSGIDPCGNSNMETRVWYICKKS